MKEEKLKSNLFSKKLLLKLESKNKLLGLNNGINIVKFCNLRLFICLLIVALGYIFLKKYLIYFFLISIIIWYLLEYLVFNKRIKKYSKKLEIESNTFFENVYILLSNDNLKTSLRKATLKSNTYLAKTIKYALEEETNGKTLKEAFFTIREYIPNNKINKIFLKLVESDFFNKNIKEELLNELNKTNKDKGLSLKRTSNLKLIEMIVISLVFMAILSFIIIYLPEIVKNLIN